jgi:hypothetical protein
VRVEKRERQRRKGEEERGRRNRRESSRFGTGLFKRRE